MPNLDCVPRAWPKFAFRWEPPASAGGAKPACRRQASAQRKEPLILEWALAPGFFHPLLTMHESNFYLVLRFASSSSPARLIVMGSVRIHPPHPPPDITTASD
jgi:hypothetical protein